MKHNGAFISSIRNGFDRNPEWALLTGAVLMSIAHLRFTVTITAYLCMVPFLWYLSKDGIKAKLLKFSLVLFAAWSLIVLKIITPPLPVYFLFLYSLPITLIHLPGYWVWAKMRTKPWGFYLFPVVMVIAEWVQYTFTPLGSWGAAAYMVARDPVMIQGLSLFGMTGLSFLIYAINLAVFAVLVNEKHTGTRVKWVLPVILIVLIYGEARIAWHQGSAKDMIKVAAIDTDSEAGGLPLPSAEKNKADIQRLLERTRKASGAGAEVVVWTEAAFLIMDQEDEALLDSLILLSRQQDIILVASHVKLISTSPLRYANRYWYLDRGIMRGTYHKHEPVPGEPAVKGTEAFQVFERDGSLFGGAICYDYDFPYIARAYGRSDADIVALPSSDWRGIDPLHTEMAAFRAVEQGHSIVRATRFGLSAAIDPTGQLVARMSSFDSTDKIMLASVPRNRTKTIYHAIGDAVLFICLGYVLLFLFKTFRNRLCC